MTPVEEPIDLVPPPTANPQACWALGLSMAPLGLAAVTAIVGVRFGFNNWYTAIPLIAGLLLAIPAVVLGILGLQKAESVKAGYELSVAAIALGVVSFVLPLLFVPALVYRSAPVAPLAENPVNRARGTNNLKQIGLATLFYHDQNGQFPTPVMLSNPPRPGESLRLDGKGLSWRVALLPHMEQETLFRQYDLQKSWNEGKNAALSASIVPAYTDPDFRSVDTPYQAFVGRGTAFDPSVPRMRVDMIPDGLSNTILYSESSIAVPWASPRDMRYTAGGALPPVGRRGQSMFLAAMGDGSVRSFQTNIEPAKLHALIQIADGRVIED